MKKQLIHPEGKKAVTMDSTKYDLLRKTICDILEIKHELSHKELLLNVNEYFKLANIQFSGSVNWHFEWVKLDLEARNIIARRSDQVYHLVKK